MTHQQWVKLSNEEKQQKMEKLCGFTRHNDKFGTYTTFRANLWKNKLYGNYKIPDFLNDLNAMHQAESTMSGKQAEDYDMCLWVILKRDWDKINNPNAIIASWYATPSQRAEAFVLAMEKK